MGPGMLVLSAWYVRFEIWYLVCGMWCLGEGTGTGTGMVMERHVYVACDARCNLHMGFPDVCFGVQQSVSVSACTLCFRTHRREAVLDPSVSFVTSNVLTDGLHAFRFSVYVCVH